MPEVTINGMKIEVEPGTSIIQAAEQLGIEIPRFCYHDKLSVPANCRMCLVEVEGGPPKPVASCAMACGDGMVVQTESDMVKKARKGVMEMLLINHPLDCPICDQGGECDLQDQAVGYGFDRSRFHENKRAVPDKELGPLIETVMTRCINCTRCVRFAEEVAGTPVLGQFHRGEDAEIGTFIEGLVETELSGNLIDICPVGALTSKPYAFSARSWELRKTESIDVHDAVGSNIRIDARGREVMRILPRQNDDINEEWIGDRTRFSYDGLNRARLDRPYVRDGKTLREASWEEALATIAAKLKGLKGEQIAALAGDLVDLESMVALKDLMTGLGSENIECRTDGMQIDTSRRAGYIFNAGIAGIENADAILLVGTNPRWEGTMVNARIRKTWLDKRIKIGVIGEPWDLTYPYQHLGTGPGDLEKLDPAFAKILKSAKNPMIIVGAGAFQRKDGQAIQNLVRETAEKFKASYNVLHTAASRVGGLDIDFTSKQGAEKILEEAKAGTIKALYLLGADEFNVKGSVGAKPFVIYQGHHGDHGAQRADVILPGAAYTEKDATYVNTEGRLQRAPRAVFPPGEAKEDWKILRALSEEMGKTLPYDTLIQLRERIVGEWKHLSELDILPQEKMVKFGKSTKVTKTAFQSPIRNYYLTNAICRASETMSKCSTNFNTSTEQFAEAAE